MRFICLVVLVLVVACDGRQSRKKVLGDVSAVKQLELQSVLGHYKNNGDTLHYNAALFLIRNMTGLSSVDLVKKIEKPDVQYITAQYLIDNIDLAVQQCGKSLSDGSLPFRDFCEYVLPYRLGNELLSGWREKSLLKYRSLADSMDIINRNSSKYCYVVSAINRGLIDQFKYSSKAKPANFQTWEELAEAKTGDCWAMTNTITYPLRALGIPAGIDFITFWGNANGGGHAWNALVMDGGRDIPFLGFEASPSDYDPFRIYKSKNRYPAKIFRKTFSKNAEALNKLVSETDAIPNHLNFDRVVDVTDHYLPTNNIKFALKNKVCLEVAYLSVFSNGFWQPVYWSRVNSGSYTFDKMAAGLLYMPSSFGNLRINEPLDYPFAVLGQKILRFKPDKRKFQDIKIDNTQSSELDALSLFGLDISKDTFYRRMEAVLSGKKRSKPVDGESYKLFYWDNGWVLTSEVKKIPEKELIFTKVPHNAIYRLTSSKSNGKERIFSYHDGQVWW
jgi:hypothetical protein